MPRRRVAGPLSLVLGLAVAALVLVNLSLSQPPGARPLLPRTATAAQLDVPDAGSDGSADRAPQQGRLRDTTDAAGAAASASTTTTTVAPPPPPPPPPVDTVLRRPERVPEQWERRPISIIGRIQIPKIGIDHELRNQITQESIDLGPSHWPGTAAPGAEGNAVIAGHRSSHSAPFHDLGNLRPGDTINLVDSYGRSFTYAITEMYLVYPDAMWITDQAPGRTLTLFTCHPIGSEAQRLVVKATLV